MDQETRRNIIMDNYNNPINRKKNDNDDFIKVNTNNSSCIDNIDIYLKIKNNVIEDITFDGEACAISISSTSIMIKNLIGKTIEEAQDFINNFEQMINEASFDKDLLNDALAYEDISKQGSRKTCAFLPYIGVRNALCNNDQKDI